MRASVCSALSVLAVSAGMWFLFFGVPRAYGVAYPGLDSVIVYPNPFQARAGHTVIYFGNLTASARIRIYKMTGELVSEKDVSAVDGKAAWDVTNNDGNAVADGLYIYLVTNDDGQKKTGKVAILR